MDELKSSLIKERKLQKSQAVSGEFLAEAVSSRGAAAIAKLELAAEYNTRAGQLSGLDALDWLQMRTGQMDPQFVLQVLRKFPVKKGKNWDAYFFAQRILSKLDDSRYKWSDGQKRMVLKVILKLAENHQYANLQRVIHNKLK